MERSRVPLYMGHQVKSYFDNGGIRVSKYGTKRYQDFSILSFHPREETRGLNVYLVMLIHSHCRGSINITISGPKSKPLNQVNKIKIIWVNKILDFSKVPRSEFQEYRVYKY